MDVETRKLERLNGAHDFSVNIGMALAAAILARDFGDDTRALEILGAAGLDEIGEVESLGLDDYDFTPLKRILKTK